MTLEEDPDAIWMTGPPPRMPFAAAGLRWRMAISLALPVGVGALLLLHAALWAGGLTDVQNLAVLVVSVAAVVGVLLAVWTSWRPRTRGRRGRRA